MVRGSNDKCPATQGVETEIFDAHDIGKDPNDKCPATQGVETWRVTIVFVQAVDGQRQMPRYAGGRDAGTFPVPH